MFLSICDAYYIIVLTSIRSNHYGASIKNYQTTSKPEKNDIVVIYLPLIVTCTRSGDNSFDLKIFQTINS